MLCSFNIENRDKIQVIVLVTKDGALVTSCMRQLALNLHPGP